MTYDRELDYSLEENSETVLREIDAALQRIEDGTYGVCEGCGKPIEEERLEAIPWTPPLHRRRAQAGDPVNEPARVVDVRVGSSNDALDAVLVRRALARGEALAVARRSARSRSRHSPPTS